MKRLIYLIPLLVAIPAQGQSLWRNFFTTNRNPIVEVVAGSNATVQASTVGVNLRRFTVNAVPGSSGFASNVFGTNVIGAVAEATHATNADLATKSTYVSDISTNQIPLSGITNANHLTNWATLNTNVLSTLGQTNISYTAVTNAPWQYRRFGSDELGNTQYKCPIVTRSDKHQLHGCYERTLAIRIIGFDESIEQRWLLPHQPQRQPAFDRDG